MSPANAATNCPDWCTERPAAHTTHVTAPETVQARNGDLAVRTVREGDGKPRVRLAVAVDRDGKPVEVELTSIEAAHAMHLLGRAIGLGRRDQYPGGGPVVACDPYCDGQHLGGDLHNFQLSWLGDPAAGDDLGELIWPDGQTAGHLIVAVRNTQTHRSALVTRSGDDARAVMDLLGDTRK